LDGKVAASVGFGGEVRVWECNDDGTWKKKGDVIGALLPSCSDHRRRLLMT
jgi:superkiller protein 8